jgi:peptide/nickel transport system substrate-binding protein
LIIINQKDFNQTRNGEKMSEKKISRREFIKLSAVGLASAAMVATSAPTKSASSQAPQIREVSGKADGEVYSLYHEAPELRGKVTQGALPSVELRLPEHPLVVSGVKEIGTYGGMIRMIHKDPVWFISNYDLNSDRILQYSDQDLRTIEANIFESWQVSSDAREWTFHMRSGMKWSDGSPLTSEDIRFWWEDVMNNLELAPWVPKEFRIGGSRMVVTIIDAYTLKFIFAASFGNFTTHLTRYQPFTSVLLPSAYMKQFHVDYADPAKLSQLITQYGFTTWVELFNYMNQWGEGTWVAQANPTQIPVLSAWHIVSNQQTGVFLWERNPYYWKIDLVGNQLPYISGLRFDLVSNDTEVKSRLSQGQIDLLGQHDVSMADYPYYQAHTAQGNYIIGDYLSCMVDRYVLFPQHYIAGDSVLTDIVNHPNFVKALSVAINREAINQVLFYNLANMGQMSVMPNSKYYKAAYGTAWAQYDKPLANQLLDAMGLDKRDSENYRLRSDGQRLTFTIEHAGERIGPSAAAFADAVASYWRAVDIDSMAVSEDESIYGQHMSNYQVHCAIWPADRCTDMLWHIDPCWFIPTNNGQQGTACSAWANWYTAEDRSDPNLIVPPLAIQTLYGYFDQMTTTQSETERVQYGQQILDYLAANPLEIGVVLDCPAPLLFNKFMRNLPPAKAPIGWDTYGLSTYHPETFFFNYPYHVYLPFVKK